MIEGEKLHLYIHPAIQLLGIVFGYVAMYWGAKRFLVVHKKMKFTFPWSHHVLYGKIAILLWLIGLSVGVYFTYMEWNNHRITSGHYIVGMIFFPLLLATFLTGYWMELFKKRRDYLCIMHGALGFILCIFAFLQVLTGVQIFSLFIW
jgi:hypothetical protein